MPLIKKRDVKNYFAARRRARSHPLMPLSQPDAATNAGLEIAADPPTVAEFVEDFREEHSSPSKPITPGAKGRGAL